MNTNDLVISTEDLSKFFGEVHALKSLDVIFITVAIWRFNRQEF